MVAKKKRTFKDQLRISKESVNSDLKKIPSMIYHYGLQENKLLDDLESVTLKLKLKRSKLGAQFRAKYRRMKNKPGETEIKDMVNCSGEVIELEEKIVELNKLVRLSKLRMYSLTVKREAIFNLGHNMRKERNS